MAYEFRLTQQIQFVDTDMAGIMHFTNFFRLMEITENSFYRSLGFSVYSIRSEDIIGFPRVRVACDFKLPVYFEDSVETHLLVRAISQKSLSYTFIFRKSESESSEEVARGELTVACVTMRRDRTQMQAVPIPDTIRNSLNIAPKELFNP